ncbi:hypothetical protein CLF_108835 [Clonorchis sinensis]|uniref:Peptidase A2 domain-containing protein n=1 Tax=Clonorchis sinensis TaxID=79923 RepID=G7YIM4_CLOSI|nr:hypothetical protein CLF_108835 [Clonorchis sinensis]
MSATFRMKSPGRRKFVTVCINGTLVTLQLETGSDLTLIPKQIWDLIGKALATPTKCTVRYVVCTLWKHQGTVILRKQAFTTIPAVGKQKDHEPKPKKKGCTSSKLAYKSIKLADVVYYSIASGGRPKMTGKLDCSVTIKGVQPNGTCYLTSYTGLDVLSLGWINERQPLDQPLNAVCTETAADGCNTFTRILHPDNFVVATVTAEPDIGDANATWDLFCSWRTALVHSDRYTAIRKVKKGVRQKGRNSGHTGGQILIRGYEDCCPRWTQGQILCQTRGTNKTYLRRITLSEDCPRSIYHTVQALMRVLALTSILPRAENLKSLCLPGERQQLNDKYKTDRENLGSVNSAFYKIHVRSAEICAFADWQEIFGHIAHILMETTVLPSHYFQGHRTTDLPDSRIEGVKTPNYWLYPTTAAFYVDSVASLTSEQGVQAKLVVNSNMRSVRHPGLATLRYGGQHNSPIHLNRSVYTMRKWAAAVFKQYHMDIGLKQLFFFEKRFELDITIQHVLN